MSTPEVQELLRAYGRDGSETAFRELVARYVDLVYSVALRRVGGDAHLAQDVTQEVFIALARQARSLPPDCMLGGWLHRHTGFVASNVMRAEKRRTNRERMAAQMNSMDAWQAWERLAPMLDEMLDRLDTLDRNALVLRFYEQRDLRAVGAALGVGEDAAQKRVSRALDKLRGLLGKRGITISSAALGSLLLERTVEAAPGGLVAQVVPVALAAASVGGKVLVANFLSGATVKLALAAVGVALIGALWISFAGNSSPAVPSTVDKKNAQPTAVSHDVPVTATAAGWGMTARAGEVADHVLELRIVTADTGKPLPNVPLDYLLKEDSSEAGTPITIQSMPLRSSRLGECRIPWTPRTTELELVTRLEGFADTSLHWHLRRGDEIPAQYTLKLARATAIGGMVVDEEGAPVPGAVVGFNHEEDPGAAQGVESHDFGWIETTSDSDGRWRMDRIASDMITRLYGAAKHADYVGGSSVHLSDHPEYAQALVAQQHVFRIVKGVVVQGTVVDQQDQPVQGAKVLVGTLGLDDCREAMTDQEGRFAVKGCRIGDTLLSVEARGYQATTQPIKTGVDSALVKVVLGPGKQMWVRVVDALGRPVQKASLILNMHGKGWGRGRITPWPQTGFQTETDADGHGLWENAPDQEMTFDCQASGFMSRSGIKLRPGDKEHVIVLSPVLRIGGTVRDASTDQSIKEFRIICGWPGAEGEPVQWSPLERFWLRFKQGTFSHAFDEPVVVADTNPGYVLKFEAEGYQSFISSRIGPEEGNVRLDVKLHRDSAARPSSGP